MLIIFDLVFNECWMLNTYTELNVTDFEFKQIERIEDMKSNN